MSLARLVGLAMGGLAMGGLVMAVVLVSGSAAIAETQQPSVNRGDFAADRPKDAGTATAAQQADLATRVKAALGLRGGVVTKLNVNAERGKPQVVSAPVAGRMLTIDLQPRALRHENYKLIAQEAGGVQVNAAPSVESGLRGWVREIPGATVAGGLLSDGLYLSIRMPEGEHYWIEPVAGRAPPEAGAAGDDYIIYTSADTTCAGECGLNAPMGGGPAAGPLADQVHQQLGRHVKANGHGHAAAGAAEPSGGGIAGLSPNGQPLCRTQLACDADFEYFDYYGTVHEVEDRINLLVGIVNQQYEAELAITHVITTIIVRTTEDDPFTSMIPSVLLLEFRAEWNAHFDDVPRDVAKLFTGRELDGSVIGIATGIGAICNLDGAYCLSQIFGVLGCNSDLVAHELGHLWNGSHCDCPFYTMNPSITCANMFDPFQSIPEILGYKEGISCLFCADCTPGSAEGGPDCNGNGTGDLCDIADAAVPDCNGNSVPDSCDISAGDSSDCNGNGVPDDCDLAFAASADCNDDGVPDDCQDALASYQSPLLAPLDAATTQSYTLASLPSADGSVTLSFAVSADLGFSTEFITVFLGDAKLGAIFGATGSDCTTIPLTENLAVDAATWNALAKQGAVTITLAPSEAVDPLICGSGSSAVVSVSYQALAPLDKDADGELDSCDTGNLSPDLNGDGDVDGLDLAVLLGDWTGAAAYSPCPPAHEADLNEDCRVNGLDLALLLGSWG